MPSPMVDTARPSSGSVGRLLTFAALCCCAAAALLGWADPAAAEPVYVPIGSFGTPAGGPGELTGPHRLAVDPASGDVLVADTAAGRVAVYAPTAAGAEYLFSFGEGELSRPLGIAVDPTDGDVYVSDPGAAAILKFAPDDRSHPTTYSPVPGYTGPVQGTEEGQVGSFGEVRGLGAPTGAIAVDPTDGDLLVADPGRGLVERFGPGGAYISAFDGSTSGAPFSAPADISIDSAGRILVADLSGSGARLLTFGADGSYLGSFGPEPFPASNLAGVVAGFDPTGASVLAASKLGFDSSAIRLLRFGPSSTEPSAELEAPGQDGYALGLAGATNPGPRLYLDASASLFGTGAVTTFEAIEPPATTIDPPGAIGTTGASFSGTVDPGGAPVGACEFQYVTEAHFAAEGFADASSVPCVPAPGSGEGPEPVTASAGELAPATGYRVRLRATGRHDAPGISETVRFTTSAAPPGVATGAAWSISDTTATLTGTVDPENSALAECRFEYGTGEGYGSSVPCSPAGVSGGEPVAVHGDVVGLAPASAYHYRLVATGVLGGPQPGADRTLTTRTVAEAELPARGYELVSAADTNGVDPLPLAAAEGGEEFVYATFIPVPGAESGIKALFRSVRRPDGSWTQAYASTPAPPPGEDIGGNGGFLFSAPDLSSSAFTTGQGLDPDDRNGAGDIYIGHPGAPFTWASRDPGIQGPQVEPGDTRQAAYISPDGTRVLFESARHLLPVDRSETGRASLYESDRGRLSLIGILPGETLGSPSGSELGSGGENPRGTSYGAVSADGRIVAFSGETEGSGSQLYLRIDGDRTVQVSRPAPGVEPPVGAPRQVTFWGADSNARLVFFTSTSALTPDSGARGEEGEADLYAYDSEDGTLHDLTPGAGGGGVRRVYDVSADGRRVYFTSTRTLVPGEGEAGEANLYLAEPAPDGSLTGPPTFIATIDPGEDENSEGLDRPQAWREVAADPSGSVLAFRDTRALVPGRASGGRPQLYVYEAERDSLSCASCPPDGSEPPAGADLLPAVPAAGSPEPAVDAVLNLIANTAAVHITDVTADGAVFFQTANALVPADANGHIDVYEWHGGKVGLISAGAEAHDSIYGGASADGSTVFFSSADSLVPGAQDGVRHIYAARVGGGAPPVPSSPPSCEGGECRAPAPPGAAAAAIGTASFSGAGNPPRAHHKKKPRRHHRRPHKAHGRPHKAYDHHGHRGRSDRRRQTDTTKGAHR